MHKLTLIMSSSLSKPICLTLSCIPRSLLSQNHLYSKCFEVSFFPLAFTLHHNCTESLVNCVLLFFTTTFVSNDSAILRRQINIINKIFQSHLCQGSDDPMCTVLSILTSLMVQCHYVLNYVDIYTASDG